MYESYVLELLNRAFDASNPVAPLSLLLLFMGRMLPIIALAPFFGARVMPHPVKIAFAVSIFVIILPALVEKTHSRLEFNPLLFLYFVKELFIGLIIGFLVSVPFTIVQNAGIIIDHQRGGASLMVNDPTVQNQSSPLGTIFNMVLIYIFFLFEGPFLVLDIILDSYDIIPPDGFFSSKFFAHNTPFWNEMIPLYNKIMIMSIEMATPGLLIILMTDFFLGIANRLAPQVQITFLGMPLKSLLALSVVALGWGAYIDAFTTESRDWIYQIRLFIKMFSYGVEQ